MIEPKRPQHGVPHTNEATRLITKRWTWPELRGTKTVHRTEHGEKRRITDDASPNDDGVAPSDAEDEDDIGEAPCEASSRSGQGQGGQSRPRAGRANGPRRCGHGQRLVKVAPTDKGSP